MKIQSAFHCEHVPSPDNIAFLSAKGMGIETPVELKDFWVFLSCSEKNFHLPSTKPCLLLCCHLPLLLQPSCEPVTRGQPLYCALPDPNPCTEHLCLHSAPVSVRLRAPSSPVLQIQRFSAGLVLFCSL